MVDKDRLRIDRLALEGRLNVRVILNFEWVSL